MGYFFVCDRMTKRREFIDLDHFHVRPEDGGLQGEVGVYIQHAAIVVPHYTQAVVLHLVRYPRCRKPLSYLCPRSVPIVQNSRDLMEGNTATPKDVENLRYGACLTMCEPLSGHLRAVLHSIKGFIIDRCLRRQIQQNHRNLRPPNHG